MGASYSIETRDGITTIRIVRDLEMDKLRDVVDELADVADEHSHLRLWDLSSGTNLTGDEVRAIAEHGRNRWPAPSKVAYLAPKDSTFGMVRMYEVYGKRGGIETRAFRDDREAVTWLKGDNQSSP